MTPDSLTGQTERFPRSFVDTLFCHSAETNDDSSRIAREPEDALGELIALDLVGPATDADSEAPQTNGVQSALVWRVWAIEHRRRAEDRIRHLTRGVADPRYEKLGDRRVRTRPPPLAQPVHLHHHHVAGEL